MRVLRVGVTGKKLGMRRKTLDPGFRRDDGGRYTEALTTTAITCM